jgi:hypothetical protein
MAKCGALAYFGQILRVVHDSKSRFVHFFKIVIIVRGGGGGLEQFLDRYIKIIFFFWSRGRGGYIHN